MPPAPPPREPVGQSPSFRRVLDRARRVAKWLVVVVLLLGETGTGKEEVARFIHVESGVAGDFLAINCGAFQDTNLEVELFGSERGAFTSAESRAGLVEAAGDGTLFLDEVGEMSPAMQVKLLRFIQSREYRRVGGLQNRIARCRIIAATNRDLKELVRQGEFREDLYFRLTDYPIVLPPLRERPEDTVLLAEVLLERVKLPRAHARPTFEQPVLDWMAAQEWPGNVRELESFIRRLAVVADTGRITMTVVEEARTMAEPLGCRAPAVVPVTTATDLAPTLAEAPSVSELILAALSSGATLREAEIIKVCGVPRSSVRGPLKGLVAEGVLEQVGERGGYRVTSRTQQAE